MTDWPGSAGLPAVPYRAGYGRTSIQLPWAHGNAETAAPEIIWGTVPPNGAVTGKVGDTYFQTSVTNTATLWQKCIGTGNTGWFRMQAEVGLYNPATYGVDLTGVGDGTTAMQQCLTDAVAAGGVMMLGPGTYKCGLLTDTSASRLQLVGCPGAVIAPTGATWLKVVPAAGKQGVRLRDLTFSIAHGTVMTPVVWLEGSNAGGVIAIDVRELDFGDLSGQSCDLIWARTCFEGRIENIWGKNAGNCRALVMGSKDFNSGNITVDNIAVHDAGVAVQLGQAWNHANQQLFNQITLLNVKAVRGTLHTGAFQTVTLTAGGNQGDTTLTVSAGDVTKIANALAAGSPQWVVCADNTPTTGDVIQATAASGTLITLAAPLPQALANSTILAVGTFGVAILANTRGVTAITPHCESVGCGFVGSDAQAVTILDPICPSDATGTVATTLGYWLNGSVGCKAIRPIYSKAGTALTVWTIENQGSNQDCDLVEPKGFGSGGGPTFFTNRLGLTGNPNRFRRAESPGSTVTLTYGVTVTPDESYDTSLVSVTDGVGFTVALPLNRAFGTVFRVTIANASGGAHGTITPAAGYQLVGGAFPTVANGKQQTVTFKDDGANIHEVGRTSGDITT